MKTSEFWKNFDLGEELGIAGAFIYNGLRRFHEMRALDYEDEFFEVFYNLSVGLERLLKVAVVLVEYDEISDQEEFEKSLITHSHQALLERIRKHEKPSLGTPHNDLLALLGRFYKSFRYGRFSITSSRRRSREQAALFELLNKHLGVSLTRSDSLLITENTDRYRKHIRKLVLKVSAELYRIVYDRASKLNLYTYELRYGSKASTIFQRDPDNDFFLLEELTWKELLVYFMNSSAKGSGALEYLRNIDPLEFDPAMIPDYFESFRTHTARMSAADEVEEAYDLLEKPGERLEAMSLIGNPAVLFDDNIHEDDA